MKNSTVLSFAAKGDLADLVSAGLFELGCQGITEKEEGLHEAFFPDDSAVVEKALALLKSLHLTPVLSTVENRDWMAIWRENANPVQLTPSILVLPESGTPAPGRAPIRLVIPPKMSFGTGHHESTRLCARLVEKEAGSCGTMLDLGTGSGILAVAAEKMGFARIAAMDNDPTVLENIAENTAVNRCSRVCAAIGTIDALRPGAFFDLVCANIISSVIYGLLPALIPRAGKTLVFGGILVSEREPFRKTMAEAGLRLKEELVENEWYAASFSKNG